MVDDAQEVNMDYVVIIEKGEEGYGAYVPDLPGCAAAADTIDEAVNSSGRRSRSISR
jgi:hypothetical protein